MSFRTQAAPTSPPRSGSLYHASLNPNAAQTVVLLHGLTSSHREWAPVAAILARDYHVLMPDLPGHSQSRAIQPFTLDNAARYVAKLMDEHANLPCHLVGFSAGGYTALTLAEQRPDLLQSVYVSGVYNMGKSHWAPFVKFAPYIDASLAMLQRTLPQNWTDAVTHRMGLKFSRELQQDLDGNRSVALAKQGFATVMDFGDGKPVNARACAVAGAKQDDVKGVTSLGFLLRQGNALSRAYAVDGAMHWWNLQWEELFAAGVVAWIKEEEMPKQFRLLE